MNIPGPCHDRTTLSSRWRLNAKSTGYDAFRYRIWTLPMAAKRKDWKATIKGMLKAELKRQNLSYADLAEKLAAIGVKDNELNIKNKIGRGSFTAVFFFQCMEAIGCQTIHLGSD